ncbi:MULTISPECIES: histone-like nucleoid-structuring protein, MvaT/MvaU family [Pseudomonas]|uniref:H-NS histone n=1 Tax=Pseudomonas putida TaxID=303 RepID=A0A1Y3KA08_PSEPU|nr:MULTISPECIES: histone-like nucleoid-structuring protein, MvaT/MvaU family [Pseudomonas]MBR7522013.1 DNA binding protein [Pseudomonas juntendi]OUM22658.1 H-NS histone [Pseudomonas putida]
MDKLIQLLGANNRIANECSEAMPLVRDPEVIKGFDFLTRLDVLAEKYQFAPRDIILLLDPGFEGQVDPGATPNSAPKSPKTRKSRPMKSYHNPHTGEVVQTRGANHKLLKQWKAVHGAAEVEKWRR